MALSLISAQLVVVPVALLLLAVLSPIHGSPILEDNLPVCLAVLARSTLDRSLSQRPATVGLQDDIVPEELVNMEQQTIVRTATALKPSCITCVAA